MLEEDRRRNSILTRLVRIISQASEDQGWRTIPRLYHPEETVEVLGEASHFRRGAALGAFAGAA